MDEQRRQEDADAGVEQAIGERHCGRAEAREGREEQREGQAEQEEGPRQAVAALAPHPAADHHEAAGDREHRGHRAPLAAWQGLGDQHHAGELLPALAQQGERLARGGGGERAAREGTGGDQAVAAREAGARGWATRGDPGDPVLAEQQAGIGLAGEAQGGCDQHRGYRQQHP